MHGNSNIKFVSPNKHFSAFLNPVGNIIASYSFKKCHFFVYNQSKLVTKP